MPNFSLISAYPAMAQAAMEAWPVSAEYPPPQEIEHPKSPASASRSPRMIFLCCPAEDENAPVICREARLREPDARLVVLMPAPPDSDSVTRMLAAGADDCLQLPRSREEFRARMDAWNKRLPEPETPYRFLFENNPLPLMIYDLETLRFLAVNKAMVQSYGYSREEILGMTIKDIHPGDDVTALMENVGEVRSRPKDEIDNAGVWKHRIKDGSIIFVEITSHPLIFNHRKAELVVAYNVNERQRIESELRTSEGRFASFMKNLPGVAFIKDRSGAYAFANAGWEDLFNLSFKTSRGQTDEDLFPPEMAQQFRENDALVTRLGKAIQVREQVHDKSGTRHWLVVKFPIAEGDDPAALIGGVAIEVTKEKQAEEALIEGERELREAHELLHFHVNNTPLAVVEWDNKFRVSYWSTGAEKLFGWSPSEVTGLHPDNWTFVHPDDADRVKLVMADLIDHTTPHNICQNRNFTKDGSIVHCEWYNSVRFNENGKLSSIFSLVDNVTDRIQAEQQLAELNADLAERVAERTARLEAVNEELESFCYSVSHDLRAPLRGIDGFSRALEEVNAIQLDETARGYLGRVRTAAERMGQLIDDLLQLSRISRVELRRNAIDLSALAATIIGELRQREPERPVEVEIQPGIQVSGDARLLRIMLENLLNNAWKFTSKTKDARITFDTTPNEAGRPVCRIRDNGVGFDMRYAHKLFSPFQRLHALSEFPGTGIGLATVKRIVKLHGGRVWAEGAPNQGATVSFSLN